MQRIFRRAAKLLILPLVGFCTFWAGSEWVHSGPPVTVDQETIVAVPGAPPGYLGVLVDRTRHEECPATYTRYVTRDMSVDGKQLPVYLPLQSLGPIAPLAGREKFVLVLPIPAGLSGPWKAQSSAIDRCHAWNWIWGSKPRLSPAVPISGSEANPPPPTGG